jgi:hypothetical protein
MQIQENTIGRSVMLLAADGMITNCNNSITPNSEVIAGSHTEPAGIKGRLGQYRNANLFIPR